MFTVLSERHLRRILKALGLRRRSDHRPLHAIRQAIENELKHWSPAKGIRAMYRRIRDGKGLRPCYRDVHEFMRELDGSGLVRRRAGRKRIERRNYFSHGPNDSWHIDGNDKLRFYGIWIHISIDGFSRYLIWIKAGTSNRKQNFIARYFLDAVSALNGCPRLMRADRRAGEHHSGTHADGIQIPT